MAVMPTNRPPRDRLNCPPRDGQCEELIRPVFAGTFRDVFGPRIVDWPVDSPVDRSDKTRCTCPRLPLTPPALRPSGVSGNAGGLVVRS